MSQEAKEFLIEKGYVDEYDHFIEPIALRVYDLLEEYFQHRLQTGKNQYARNAEMISGAINKILMRGNIPEREFGEITDIINRLRMDFGIDTIILGKCEEFKVMGEE